jgi:type IV pilus assembly protein PilY1
VTPPAAVTLPRDYFVDGAVTVYQKLDESRRTERAVIFVTMRRGGRLLYAFDVTTPSDPVLLWRKTNADIPVLGQTWSDARLALLKGHPGPVLVLGAGYDATVEDATVPGPATMGNAVLVLDAMSGAVLKTLATDRAVPAAVALLDTDFDGYTDRAYAADTGANVYRIDFEDAGGDGDSAHWRIAKFAALGASGARKFLHAPDVVQTRLFTAVLLGSGDREKPLAPYYPYGAVTNDRFYTLLDRGAAKGPSGLPLIDESQLTVTGSSGAPAANVVGCYLPLDAPRGEKVVTSAVSTGGYTYFSTNTPTDTFSTNSCATPLGTARSYRVALFCGEVASQEYVGGGLPPSPVAGLVEVEVPGSDPTNPGTETKQVPFIIGGFNAQLSGLQASRVPINVDPTRRRTYWFTNKGH